MRALLTVFLKELGENARDRRTVLSALLLGPIGAPLLFTVMMNIGLARGHEGAERPLELAVAGGEHAPNLIGFLRAHGAKLSEFAGDPAAAVRAHERRLVLVVPEEIGARLGSGRPAAVHLFTDSSDTSAAGDRARATVLLHSYSAVLAAWRLEARGVSPALLQPLVVDEVDIATPTTRAIALLGMLSYFILFATLMGGVYVAIDATAGERERGSLEPLLTLPVARGALVAGKILAAAAWMSVSLSLTVAAFTVSLRFVRLDVFGMATNLGPRVALAIIALMLPFALLGAALMTLVASFTRSYREAQSWLTAVVLVPTLPIMFAALYQLQGRLTLMWIPSLSQHFLINALLRAEPLHLAQVLTSVLATLAFALALGFGAARLYRREQILG
jgi:sodium transport system permease protein